MQILILTEHLKLQLLQLLQTLSLQSVVLLHHLLVVLQQLVRLTHHKEPLIFSELLPEAVDQRPAPGVECLQSGLYLLQFLLFFEVLVLLSGCEVIFEFVPGEIEYSLVAFLDLLPRLELFPCRQKLLKLFALIRIE